MKDSSRFALVGRLGTLEKPARYGAVCVHAVSVDGDWLVSRGPSHQNSHGYLWKLSTGESIVLGGKIPVAIARECVLGIEIDREGAFAVAWSVPGLDERWRLRVWTGNCVRSDPAYASHGDRVAVGYDQPPAVHVRRIGDGATLWLDDRPAPGRDLSGRGLAFSPAGDRLYAVTQHYSDTFHHVVTAYEAASGSVLWTHDAGADVARVVATDDAVIALFRTIQVLDPADGRLVAERAVPVENRVIQACALSPQGELFLGGEGFALLVDPRSGEELDRWPFPAKRFPTSATFSSDGNCLFLGTNGAVILCYRRR